MQSVQVAPHDGKDTLALAHANRSAALFHLGRYKVKVIGCTERNHIDCMTYALVTIALWSITYIDQNPCFNPRADIFSHPLFNTVVPFPHSKYHVQV